MLASRNLHVHWGGWQVLLVAAQQAAGAQQAWMHSHVACPAMFDTLQIPLLPPCRFVDNLQTQDARIARASQTLPRTLTPFLARGLRPSALVLSASAANLGAAAGPPSNPQGFAQSAEEATPGNHVPRGTLGAAAAAGVLAATAVGGRVSPALVEAAVATSVRAAEQNAEHGQQHGPVGRISPTKHT